MVTMPQAREHLVGERPHAYRDLVHAHALADDGGEIASARATVRDVGDVDGDEIHGYATDERTTLPGNDDLGGAFSLSGARGSQKPVRISHGKRSHPAWARRNPLAA